MVEHQPYFPVLSYISFHDATEALVCLLPFLSPLIYLFIAPTMLPLQAHPLPCFLDVVPFAMKSQQEYKSLI